MSFYIVVREMQDTDTPAVSQVVRNAYASNIYDMWLNALFHEVTFQLIIMTSAVLFICFGTPLTYCILSIPIILIMLYMIIYGTIMMKTAELLYEKKPLNSWVAEAYEPFFYMKQPEDCWYKILSEDDLTTQEIPQEKFRRRIVGTIAVSKHLQQADWAWLFRLTVEKKYRRKGIGLKLIESVQNWCRHNQFNNIEVAMSECQEGARELFNEAGFEVKQLYHRKLFSNTVTLQMFQLRCEVRQTF